MAMGPGAGLARLALWLPLSQRRLYLYPNRVFLALCARGLGTGADHSGLCICTVPDGDTSSMAYVFGVSL